MLWTFAFRSRCGNPPERHIQGYKKVYQRFLTYRLPFLPHLHGRFVFLEFVTPVGVNFLIVVAFIWGSASVRESDKSYFMS